MNWVTQKFQTALRKLTNKITAKTWPEKSIVFWAGTGLSADKYWSPLSLKQGIGGSEIAVINLCREWAKLGYQVTVYNSCQGQEGCYDGVNYVNYSKFNEYDHFDTLIIWRFPWRLNSQTKARRIWLDLHEFLLPEQLTKKKLSPYQKIFVKSQAHRQMLTEIEDEQIAIIPNGVESRYIPEKNPVKLPYKLIYASDYTRGLERMLTYGWPIIKKEIPEAELNIYYGFGAVDTRKGNEETIPNSPAWQEKMLKLMEQAGVKEKGRIGVEDLIKEKATASIHYYGCTFLETDCISIRESALVGCIPVTSTYGALGEKEYCVRVEGNPFEQATQEALAHQIVELLKQPEGLESMREAFQQLAAQETWEAIARKWLSYET